MYRLNVAKLREAAARLGDTTVPEIYRRAGIAESSAYRWFKDEGQPDLNSALRLGAAYGVPVESFMELVEETDAESVAA
ncbi:XRE family transcriptional regulator [Streptomyces chryseus]|uniref:XRE family transcriptional regulator n=1 Tax=Streptomyces chryseus TaxID=68186 RepID=UPI00110F73FC|nr:XRE family transcriptional regulator [Streptomyces chryseus]GGX02272.1 hypothetical protein GCM10010353_17490 [Streptomyces chryseus]